MKRTGKRNKLLYGVMTTMLVCSTAIVIAQGHGTKTVVPNVSLTELKQGIADKAVVLLDCNGSKAYASCHIPGGVTEIHGNDLRIGRLIRPVLFF